MVRWTVTWFGILFLQLGGVRNRAPVAALKPEFMKEMIYPSTVGANNYSDQSLWSD